ncbi:nucleotide-binding protein [Candidatus Methanomassiliicoccus intestinalis]|uniref:nucleotide-binding protein n=1 Tax=Candidatus Methanomassiliicoccus intestinalis TaxID=1406512 RepID=UPI0037DD9416
MKQIAIYGKGGIGKSTVSANLCAAVAELGLKTWYVGCDPKSDGSMTLMKGRSIPTFLEQKKAGAEEVVFEGYRGIHCVEVGGPMAGVGCAGRGILVAMQELSKNYLQDDDFLLYDVPGDVVCGGFASPLREGFADEVYIVTSGEYLSLYAANNIAKGLSNLGVNLGGIICNARETENEKEMVVKFAEMINSKVIGYIPRHPAVRECENRGMTVIEGDPESSQAAAYRNLRDAILANNSATIPTPVSPEVIRDVLRGMN